MRWDGGIFNMFSWLNFTVNIWTILRHLQGCSRWPSDGTVHPKIPVGSSPMVLVCRLWSIYVGESISNGLMIMPPTGKILRPPGLHRPSPVCFQQHLLSSGLGSLDNDLAGGQPQVAKMWREIRREMWVHSLFLLGKPGVQSLRVYIECKSPSNQHSTQ